MNSQFSVTFWDVGQGDCSTIHLPDGKIIIIDTGPRGSPLIDWLNERNRSSQIHSVIITHNDADHNGSLPALIDMFEDSIESLYLLFHRQDSNPSTMNLFRRADRAKQSGKLRVFRLEAGATIWQDAELQLSLDVIHPDFLDNVTARSRNLSSGILRLRQNGKVSVIWPGDVSLARLKKCCEEMNPEYLVGPHHGAPEGFKTREGLLAIEAVSPANAFMSVGTFNHYSHPRPKYIRRLERTGCKVWCSQLTTHCGRSQVLERKRPVMQSHAYFGFRPPRSGLACRGIKQIQLQNGQFTPDELENEFQSRIQKLRRPQCLRGREEMATFFSRPSEAGDCRL